MRSERDEQRRAQRQRLPLLVLSGTALGAAVTAQLAPNTAPWLATPRPTLFVLLATVVGLAAYAWRAAEKSPRWSAADATAWVGLLCGTAALAGAASAPVPLGVLLYCTALLLLATRDPSDALVLGACATAALAPVTRVLVHNGAGAGSLALVAGIGMMAFTAVTAQTRLLLRALAERDAALTRTSVGTRRASSVPPREPAGEKGEGDRFAALRGPAAAIAELVSRSTTTGSDSSDHSWDALVEKLRTSVTGMAESAGVSASVSAEVKGLAPPPARIRTHLVKIAQEATTQTLRTTDARSIDLHLSRADGGVVLELRDDGPASDGTRPKRTLAALRTRVTAAGGTAEVRRGDAGWVTRVKLPCEQLN